MTARRAPEPPVTTSAGGHAAMQFIEDGEVHPATVSIVLEGTRCRTTFYLPPDAADALAAELLAAAAEARAMPVREYWKREAQLRAEREGAGS